MAKKMTKKEVLNACPFDSKTVLITWDHDQVWKFINSLTAEEQEKCFESKDITVKPLTEGEIKELAFNLLENGYEGKSLFGISQKDKLDILREYDDLLTDIKESYLDRLNLDQPTTTTELRFSPAKARVIYHKHPELEI